MLLDYSENLSWTSAIAKTIDPDTSCRICQFVQEGKKQESNQDFSKSKLKIELVWDPQVVTLSHPEIANDRIAISIPRSQSLAPPKAPPPRLV
jgi:hypothetical protein